MKTLTLQVTEVSFDFDDEDFTVEEQQEVINSVVGNVFEVEVDDDDNDEDIAQALVEEVTDYTGWCVFSLDFIHILK
jgi:ABC-type branched-subunit amino acid transport system substrate-binding protein